MNSPNASTALLIVIGLAAVGFVACGSEEDGAADAGGSSGTANGTVGGATATATRGGASTGSGGANATRGGTAATPAGGRTNGVGGRTNGVGGRTNGVGGRTNGVGGRTNGVGGRTNGVGGAATAGFAAIDLTCMDGGTCTADCSAVCPGVATANYSCTCTNGQLSCDVAECVAAVVGGACPVGTADGTACDSTAVTTCAPSGGTLCVCSRQSNQWTCF